jgi:hypothetical protein
MSQYHRPIYIDCGRPQKTVMIPRDESLIVLLSDRSHRYRSEMQDIFDARKRRKLEEINNKMDRYKYHI